MPKERCCTFLLLFITVSNGDNDFFITKKYGTSEYKCITNSPLALSWIDKNAQEPFESVSRFIPSGQLTNVDCAITDDDKTRTYYTNKHFMLKRSLESNSRDMILDRRWENFRTIKTKFTGDSEKLQFVPYPVPRTDFEILLSIRTDDDAHIFLCDGAYPPKANCYWFMLYVFPDPGSSIRKCSIGLIPDDILTEPQEPCKTPLAKVKLPPEASSLLSIEKWLNLKLIKNGNHLSLISTGEKKKKTILETLDKEKMISVTHLILHSGKEDAEWKVDSKSKVSTTSVTRLGDLKFEVSPVKHDFEMPISIRTEKEGHIFLCDGPHPPKANCYWLMLYALEGEATAIRKCSKGTIPSLTNQYPSEPCKTLVHQIEPNDVYISNEFWSHFKLAKENNKISLTHIQEGTKTSILDWSDPIEVIKVTHVIFNSRLVNGLWKIHDLDYIYTNEFIHDVPIGPPIAPINGIICISMFFSICPRCILMLKLSEKGGSYSNETILWPGETPWTEIRLVLDNIQSREFILSVSTSGSSSGKFWAIDEVRQCRKEEFRIISAKESAECQLLSSDRNVISFENSTELTTIPNSCPETTIGELCVPCDLVYSDCKQITICSKDPEEGERCFCSAGFESNDCSSDCNSDYYGHGCQKNCGSNNCVGLCNKIDGTCKACPEDFTGKKCEILKATYFEKAPEITNVDFTTATIRMTNFEVQYKEKDDQPANYTFQYKEAESSKLSWNTCPYYRFYSRRSIPLEHLKAGTKYLVRGVIVTDKNKKYTGDQIPVATFTTKCKEIDEQNVIVTPSNTSVDVSLRMTSEKTCKFSRYNIYMFGRPKTKDQNNIYFDNLRPFTNYTIRFQGERDRFQKRFRTTEGIPQSVENLIVTECLPTSIRLQWKEPLAMHGILLHYIVEYHHISHLSCKSEASVSFLSVKTVTVTETSATIIDLILYSQYSFSVYAVNTKLHKGMPTDISASTLLSNEIKPEEIPKIEQIIPDITTATVKLGGVDCETLEGPLHISATTKCTNEWCNHPITTTHHIPPVSELLLGGLSPYSDYELQLKFCRTETVCKEDIVKKPFKTKPSAARPISNLEAYSTDETSISLRWTPPFPPTGEIGSYKTVFFYYDSMGIKINNADDKNSKTSCEIWPDLYCTKLTGLKNDIEYTIQVYAQNEEPPAYSEPVETKAFTRRAPSDAPYDLTANWNLENDLELKWKHPNRSNGLIQHFKIELNPLSPTGEVISDLLLVTEDTYNLTYYFNVNSSGIVPRTRYDITVSANNGIPGKEATIMDTSPPELPLLVGDPDISSTDRTITVKFTIQDPEESIDHNIKVIFLITDLNTTTIYQYPQFDKSTTTTALKVVADCENLTYNETYSITIGNRKQPTFCNTKIKNPPLLSGSSYNITLQLINTFEDKTRTNVYSYMQDTTGGHQIINYHVYNFNVFKILG